MRDYKNVKVPRRYRTTSAKTTVVRRVSPARKSASAAKTGGVLSRLFLIAAISAGSYLGWLGYRWFAQSEMFLVEAVEVQGVRRLTEKDFEIFREAFGGQNIFLVDMNSAARAAAEHPWVKEIRIFRGLPNKIRVQITEREPAAIVETSTGRYLIDDTGMVMEKVNSDGGAAAVPRIIARGQGALIGRELEDRAVKESLLLISELSKRGGWEMSNVVIKADAAESITVVYAGKEFRMGIGNYPEKLRRLSEIALDMKRRGLDFAYVELRPERQAAVKVKQ